MIRRLTRSLSQLRLFNVAMPKDRASRRIVAGAAYGTDPRQRLDLYAPRVPGDAPLPVLVFFYGGGWQRGEREGYAFAGRALAAAGFLVAVPDYRLVPGHPYPDFVEDGAAAMRWVLAHAADHGGDPGRLAIAGHSAGAYIASMLALDPRWLGEDKRWIRGLIGLAGPYDFLPLDSPLTIAAFGHIADLAPTQPINHVSADAPPTLLLHGTADETVWPRHSEDLAARLNEAGVAAKTRLYAELGHIGILTGLARPFRCRVPVLADMIAFARRATR